MEGKGEKEGECKKRDRRIDFWNVAGLRDKDKEI